MRHVVKTNKPFNVGIGYVGENLVTEIAFDFTDWLEEYGEGAPVLRFRRNGDDQAYPVTLTLEEGNLAIWTVTNTDLFFQGDGEGQLQYVVDEAVKKSRIFKVAVERSLETTEEEPDPYDDWMDALIQLTSESETNAYNASVSATNAATSEANAATSEANAATSETNAATSEANALASATAASGSATSAAVSATAASSDATDAYNSAVAAISAAASASASEENASASASSALTSANSAATSATTANNAATTASQAKDAAVQAATDANASATSASNSATSASASADRAEQAIDQGGYLNVEISDGHLIATYVNLDTIELALNNGRLYVIYG